MVKKVDFSLKNVKIHLDPAFRGLKQKRREKVILDERNTFRREIREGYK